MFVSCPVVQKLVCSLRQVAMRQNICSIWCLRRNAGYVWMADFQMIGWRRVVIFKCSVFGVGGSYQAQIDSLDSHFFSDCKCDV